MQEKRSHRNEKPVLVAAGESPSAASKTDHSQKIIKNQTERERSIWKAKSTDRILSQFDFLLFFGYGQSSMLH